MEYNLYYLLADVKGREIESGQAVAVIDEDRISIMLRAGQAISISFRDIDTIAKRNETSLRDLLMYESLARVIT